MSVSGEGRPRAGIRPVGRGRMGGGAHLSAVSLVPGLSINRTVAASANVLLGSMDGRVCVLQPAPPPSQGTKLSLDQSLLLLLLLCIKNYYNTGVVPRGSAQFRWR